jgi:Icc-related predicted phosphoesterase
MTLPTIVPSNKEITFESELGDVIDEDDNDAQTGEDNILSSWDSDSDTDSADDDNNDHIVSKFGVLDSSRSDDDDVNDNDNDEANSCESQSVGCDDNGKKGSLLEGIDDENEDERSKRSLDPDYAWDRIQESQVFLEPPVKRIPLPTKEPPPKKDFVRFVFISDTHGKHREVSYLPRGDVLVHAGDLTKSGEIGMIEDLARYFRQFLVGGPTQLQNPQPQSPSGTAPTTSVPSFRKVVCVAGNHDLTLDKHYYDQNWEKFHRKNRKFDPTTVEKAIRRDAVYLHDESHQLEFPFDPTTADANSDAINNTNARVNIWGSPYSPKFFDWAFNKERGAPIREIWNKIPSRESDGNHTTNGTENDDHSRHNNNQWKPVDVLITHGPPLGRGDLALGQQTKTRAGCYDLLEAIQHRVRPKINVFGHIHEGYGVTYDGITLYVNASTMNERYEVIHLPIVVDLPLTGSWSSENNRSASCARVVKPCSLFRNHNTNIASFEEWIAWCHHHGHCFVADTLEKRLPAKTTRNWFGDSEHDEPPPDTFFETLACVLGYEKAYNRLFREARRKLATMVFHLYAESFDDTSTSEPQIQIESGPKDRNPAIRSSLCRCLKRHS